MFESLNGKKQLCTVRTINFRVAHLSICDPLRFQPKKLVMMEDGDGLTFIDLQTCNRYLLSVMKLEKNK